jgi:adenine phosphoribosyltransferase
MNIDQISALIRDVPNFPKPGVVFKDITTVLEDGEAFRAMTKLLVDKIDPRTTKLVAIESRGFILGAAVAQHLKAGMVIVRKPGKLPRPVIKKSYALEYGEDTVEMHAGALGSGDLVTIIDDVLATGGTAHAVEELCLSTGARISGHVFLMEIEFLKGRLKLQSPVTSLIKV